SACSTLRATATRRYSRTATASASTASRTTTSASGVASTSASAPTWRVSRSAAPSRSCAAAWCGRSSRARSSGCAPRSWVASSACRSAGRSLRPAIEARRQQAVDEQRGEEDGDQLDAAPEGAVDRGGERVGGADRVQVGGQPAQLGGGGSDLLRGVLPVADVEGALVGDLVALCARADQREPVRAGVAQVLRRRVEGRRQAARLLDGCGGLAERVLR